MKNLREVTLESRERTVTTSQGMIWCYLPKKQEEDRRLHRAGTCIVHLGSLHGHCPNLVRFAGVELGGMAKSFSQWNNKMKRIPRGEGEETLHLPPHASHYGLA